MVKVLRSLARPRMAALVHALVAALECQCRRLAPAVGLNRQAMSPLHAQSRHAASSAGYMPNRPGLGLQWPCGSSRSFRSRVASGPCMTTEQTRTLEVDGDEILEDDDQKVVEVVEADDDFDAALAESESASRLAESMELLEQFSEEAHPGHQPGRFLGPTSAYEGMIHDGTRFHFAPGTNISLLTSGKKGPGGAMVKYTEADRELATKYESRGGTALVLKNAFTGPENLREAAKKVLKGSANGTQQDEEVPDLVNMAADDLHAAGLGMALGMLNEAAPVDQAMFMLRAADIIEDREAVMRNVWTDIEFDAGEDGNRQLVSLLEAQFSSQLLDTLDADQESQEAEEEEQQPEETSEDSPDSSTKSTSRQEGVFAMVLHGSAGKNSSEVSEEKMEDTLSKPRNLGVALDLVGAYLKNYELDKADRVITRIMPLCRKRAGTWLVKGLDKLCLVRMKQHRSHEALACLKEIESVVPFTPEQGWEFYDILYRNLACAYSSLEDAEQSLAYRQKCVEVKRNASQPASWFDIWDVGKGHARYGQQTKQLREMKMAYNMIVKAGEIHRKAEPGSVKILAKILSNVGEVAMGIGDVYYLEDNQTEARYWYEKAEPALRESCDLFVNALGPLKPLSGWAEGNVAHCMVRLERWQEALDYLSLALKVECTKDATTPGYVVDLIDRILHVYQKLGELPGADAMIIDLETCLADMRFRGWDRDARDIYAFMLQKMATFILIADGGSGENVPRALRILEEAATNLEAFQSEGELEVMNKPETDLKVDADDLLRQVKTSIIILKYREKAAEDSPEEGGAANATDTANAEALDALKDLANMIKDGPEGEGTARTAHMPGADALDASEELENVPKEEDEEAEQEAEEDEEDSPAPTGAASAADAAADALEALKILSTKRKERTVEFSPAPPDPDASKWTLEDLGSAVSNGVPTADEFGVASGLAKAEAPIADDLGAARGQTKPEEKGVGFYLAGNWDGWNGFKELSPEGGRGSIFTGAVLVPPGQDIEFQILCDRSYDKRFFPAVDGREIIGPSPDGHNKNWRVPAPARPAALRVRWDPTGQRRMDYDLDMKLETADLAALAT